MTTLIHEWVEAAHQNANDAVIARMRSGWVVLADPQVLPGYVMLLSDPVVADLGDLQGAARAQFLDDMATLGDVLTQELGAERINYEILGNGERALHAHVFPRYANEILRHRRVPLWQIDWSHAPRFDPKTHSPLMRQLAAALDRVGAIHDVP